MSINSVSSLKSTNNINYRTPQSLHFKRLVFRILEIWRSVTSTFQSFFKNSTNKIEKGNLLSSSDILKNIREKTSNLGFSDQQVINQKIEKGNLKNIINNSSDKLIIFLPYTISGYFRDHIVFFAVNKTTKEIIFYDSKGWSLADYKLENIFEIIKEEYPNFNFVQNTKKEQYDTFNCGVYVLKRIIKLDEDSSVNFEDLLKKNPISYHDVMKARKDDLIQTSNYEEPFNINEVIIIED